MSVERLRRLVAAQLSRRFGPLPPKPSGAAAAHPAATATPAGFSGPRRYVPAVGQDFAALRAAAEQYPQALAESEGFGWMRRKPYDPTERHLHFFQGMYAILNAVQAMRLPPGALVMDVGSGPGWVTQILVGLGYRVVALDPSEVMHDLARQRLQGFEAMTGVAADAATFVTATLEEADLAAYLARVDAVMFHEALHHVIDEHAALGKVFALLRPGGCLSVSGEGSWTPGDTQLERSLDAEMARYGTLESPFTRPYLQHVLETVGFEDIRFHLGVNGMFAEAEAHRELHQVASTPAGAAHALLARRPMAGGLRPAAADPGQTAGEIEVLAAAWAQGGLVVRVRLRNTGRTLWPAHVPPSHQGVTLALTRHETATDQPEAANRYPLPQPVPPGGEAVLDWRFEAAALEGEPCYLRLVAEHAFWFPGALRVKL